MPTTTPRNFRLSDSDIRRIEIIKEHLKNSGYVSNDTAAVKKAIHFYADYIEKGKIME